jgi:hypothetical protein
MTLCPQPEFWPPVFVLSSTIILHPHFCCQRLLPLPLPSSTLPLMLPLLPPLLPATTVSATDNNNTNVLATAAANTTANAATVAAISVFAAAPLPLFPQPLQPLFLTPSQPLFSMHNHCCYCCLDSISTSGIYCSVSIYLSFLPLRSVHIYSYFI